MCSNMHREQHKRNVYILNAGVEVGTEKEIAILVINHLAFLSRGADNLLFFVFVQFGATIYTKRS